MGKKSSRSADSFNAKISLAMKSGKFCLGFNQAMGTLRAGRSKVIVVASNCHPVKKAELEYYCMLSKTPMHHYNGTNLDLGTACGKQFRTTVLSVTDVGDSDIAK
jgi:large subunit ribosomal protein L30e